MPLAPKDLYATWRGDGPIGSTNAKMAKLPTLTLGWHLTEGCSASPTWYVNHGDQYA